jgi:hypothetical protein
VVRRCINHADREAPWFCLKHMVAYCDDCCRCPHREGYCKFREQCAIWQVCLEDDRVGAASPSSAEVDSRADAEGCASLPGDSARMREG